MCVLLTAAQRDDMVRCAKGPDDEWVDNVKRLRHTIHDVEEDGDAATIHYDQVDSNPRYPVALNSTGTLHLVKVDGAWRIDDNELVADNSGA